jgi:Protein of unknown function (DUF2769)
MKVVEFSSENIDMPPRKEDFPDLLPSTLEFPGMFCARGETECGDLDYNKICKCPTCDVWKANNLSGAEPYSLF